MVDCKFFSEYLNENILTINGGRLDNNIILREKNIYEDLELIPLGVLFSKKVCATNNVLYRYNN